MQGGVRLKGRLYLSAKNKKIAGVCGGIGERFNLDPVAVRIVFIILLIIFRLPMVAIYILCWAIIPAAREGM